MHISAIENKVDVVAVFFWVNAWAWKVLSKRSTDFSLSVYTQCAPSLHPPLSQWAVRWRTKGFFQHVFRSVALFKQRVWPDRGRFQPSTDSDETAPVEPRRTHSGESVDWDHESMCVSLCLCVNNFSKSQTANRGLFDVWHFESPQMFGENLFPHGRPIQFDILYTMYVWQHILLDIFISTGLF